MNKIFVATADILAALLTAMDRKGVTVAVFQDFLDYLARYLVIHGSSGLYSVSFNLSREALDRLAAYDRDNIKYDADEDALFLTSDAALSGWAAARVVPDPFRAAAAMYADSKKDRKPSPFAFHVTEPMDGRDPTQGELASKYYGAEVTYVRDLAWDKSHGGARLHNLSAEAKPVSPRFAFLPILRITDFSDPEKDRLILPKELEVLRPAKATEAAEAIGIARDSLPELRKAIEQMI